MSGHCPALSGIVRALSKEAHGSRMTLNLG
jgi:hypothetical protein